MKWYQRLMMFLQEVWTEIRPKDGKVTWPTKDEIVESTTVVFICVAIFGVSLAVIDLSFRYLIGLVIGQ